MKTFHIVVRKKNLTSVFQISARSFGIALEIFKNRHPDWEVLYMEEENNG